MLWFDRTPWGTFLTGRSEFRAVSRAFSDADTRVIQIRDHGLPRVLYAPRSDPHAPHILRHRVPVAQEARKTCTRRSPTPHPTEHRGIADPFFDSEEAYPRTQPEALPVLIQLLALGRAHVCRGHRGALGAYEPCSSECTGDGSGYATRGYERPLGCMELAKDYWIW